MASKFIAVLILSAFASNANAEAEVQSIHTRIAGKACVRHVDDEISGASTLSCPGVAGFKLQVIEDDGRFSINVQSPNNRIFELNYWDVITRGFSSLGTHAEWRVRTAGGKGVPAALIVRVIRHEQAASGTPRSRHLLAVAQIRQNTSCVVATLSASTPDAWEQARTIADGFPPPCLTSILNRK
jgi:hypothetical protein